MKQFRRVRDKARQLAARFPQLMHLEPPVSLSWAAEFERDRGVTLPEDYRWVITHVADGGLLPPFSDERHWRSLRLGGRPATPFGVPFPLTESRRNGEGTAEAASLPGQFLLMGNAALGWSLITAGPCWGEVWTVGEFGALRVPGCTFSQWLELVLDGNLWAYMAFCMTGQDIPMPPLQRVWELLRSRGTEDAGGDGDAVKLKRQCAKWLDRHRMPLLKEPCTEENPPAFHYEGPGDGGYLRDHLVLALRTLPQESGWELSRMQRARNAARLPWNRIKEQPRTGNARRALRTFLQEDRVCWEDSAELAELTRIVPLCRAWEDGDAPPAGIRPVLWQRARRLCGEKKFEQKNSGLTDLSFLSSLLQLREIDVTGNTLSDLTPLRSLTGLKCLYAGYNELSDLTPLASLSQLYALSLQGNRVESLEPLRELRALNRLNLRGNPLDSGALACLRKCKRLGMADLTCTGLRDLSPLEFCRAWNLDLYGNPELTGLEVLATMKNLSCLYLDTVVARRYEIRAIQPRFTEYAEMGGISLYIWPEKYYS